MFENDTVKLGIKLKFKNSWKLKITEGQCYQNKPLSCCKFQRCINERANYNFSSTG